MKLDKQTGRILPVYTPEQFSFLVNLIRFGKPEDVYTYLDKMAKDERTKWNTLKKAMKKARELTPLTKVIN